MKQDDSDGCIEACISGRTNEVAMKPEVLSSNGRASPLTAVRRVPVAVTADPSRRTLEQRAQTCFEVTAGCRPKARAVPGAPARRDREGWHGASREWMYQIGSGRCRSRMDAARGRMATALALVAFGLVAPIPIAQNVLHGRSGWPIKMRRHQGILRIAPKNQRFV